MITGNPHKHNNYLHYHNGSTCHGFPTLQMCINDALRKCWQGRILEQTDKESNGISRKCYSLIASSFEHWEQYGKFVAETQISFKIY